MKTIETTATVTAEGKMVLDVPKDLAPGLHRVKVDVDERLEEDPLVKYGFDPKTTSDGRPRRYFKGKPVLTKEEMGKMERELPSEPYWEAEWKHRSSSAGAE